MKKIIQNILCTICALGLVFVINAQTTSWKGTVNSNWSNASNWTAGIPTSLTDVFIGDASFTGSFNPETDKASDCKNLTIGGAVVATLDMKKTLTISGNLLINANGTFIHAFPSSISVFGNWTNNGVFTADQNNSEVFFSGTAQTLGGSSVSLFRKLIISSSTTVTLTQNITVDGSSSYLTINGTLNPSTFLATINTLNLNDGGVLMVKAALFASNYIITLPFINNGSIVEYSAATIDQTISNSYTYSTLRIRGTGVKTLAGNLPVLNSSASINGNILVEVGTLNLSTFTANRGTTVAGGTISVSNAAFLLIGGTNSFPSNFTTRALSLNSTVSYNGDAQTVLAVTYGNLVLTASSGSVTKTFPGTAFTVGGNFSSLIGSGTSVSYTSASDIAFSGNISIGTSTTFNGGSNTHTLIGNWVNNGVFTGSTGTISINGANSNLSGSGTNNFNNITINAAGITASGSTNINVAGNFIRPNASGGTFVHNAGGLLTMTGASKTLTATSCIFNDLTISGTISSTNNFTIAGNFSVTGSFIVSAISTVSMSGVSKTMSGGGTINFSGFTINSGASVTTSSNFSVSATLTATGTFSASAGTATFTSTSNITGSPNLFNATINGTTLTLNANAVMGIANVLTVTAGTLVVNANTTNTVSFNGTIAQNVNALTFHHLTVANGNTKTAAGNITINGNLTINSTTTFNGSSFTINVLRDYLNNGTFQGSTSNLTFSGTQNATITGASTFNILTINKSTTSISVTLLNNIEASTVVMTLGRILTGNLTLNITTTRSGSGIILGNIKRTHSFSSGINYAFEGPDNYVNFSASNSVSSITISVNSGSIGDFSTSVNREYTISNTGSFDAATILLRLHYEDPELNGNSEASLDQWQHTGAVWAFFGQTSRDASNNYVDMSGILQSSFNSRWTLSHLAKIVSWNGSVSSAWNTAGNWTAGTGSPSIPPTINEVVRIGDIVFNNQPTISSAVSINNISFGSAKAATLTIGSGSLTVAGNVIGSWTADAIHSIVTNNNPVTINGDLITGNGTANRRIDLTLGSSVVTVASSIVQTSSSVIDVTGTGTLNIGVDYDYISGAFNKGTGTVIYNGTESQKVAGLNYNHLTINKASSIASNTSAIIVSGNLAINNNEMFLGAGITVNGNVTIAAAGVVRCNTQTITVKGNWTNSGNFRPGTGKLLFDGTTDQTYSEALLNNFEINKSSGTVSSLKNTIVNNNVSLISGILDLTTFTLNSAGAGVFTVSNGTTLRVGGANNFPQSYSSYALGNTSIVLYNGTVAQTVKGTTYGHLQFSNGGSNEKTLEDDITVNGDILINSGSTFNGSSFAQNLNGNWTNSGTFTPATGIVILNGTSKTITGATTFNKFTVNGIYVTSNEALILNDLIFISPTGSLNVGTSTITSHGDLTNAGVLFSGGVTTFTGTQVQTIRLLAPFTSNASGVINFNGTVAPVFNSISTPVFATLNINNTATITPSVNWTVAVSFYVAASANFNTGNLTHTFTGAFTNLGTITAPGTLRFTPSVSVPVRLAGTSFVSTGNVEFAGSGLITLTGTTATLNNVSISNTNAAGITPIYNWNVNGNLVIGSTSILNAGTFSHTVAGNLESNGTLNGETSTFTMTGTNKNLNGSPNTKFNHFINTGNIVANTAFQVQGDFTNNGTFNASSGTLIMSGAVDAEIKGTTSPTTIQNLNIRKDPSAIVTLSVNISAVSQLNIIAGTLYSTTSTITQSAGATIGIDNDATLKLGGTLGVPVFTNYIFDTASNVDFNGGIQSISNTPIYGNLKVTAAGNKTVSGPLTIANHFTLSDGTFIAGNNTHLVGGNWLMSGGTFTNTSSTIQLNGIKIQNISSTGAFNNLTINKAIGMTNLGSPITVNSNLTFTQGMMDISNYDLTIGNSGSIVSAAASKYIIAEGSGVVKQQVLAAGSKQFPVGTSTDYMPATIAFTAGSTTDIINVRVKNQAYFLGDTGSPVTASAVKGTWMISEDIIGGSDATITLQWPSILELSGFARNTSRLAHYTGGNWDYGTSNIAATGSDPYSVSRSGFTSFSPFAVSMMSALPVSWLNISAKNINADNHVSWSTAFEQNNNYFDVEVSTNGTNYSEIGRVAGAGNSSSVQQYNFIHKNINAATYYYRIKQVDLDGKFSYSKIVKVSAVEKLISSLIIAPNPVVDIARIQISTEKVADLNISVLDVSGKMIIKMNRQILKGNNIIEIDMSGFTTGIYLLNINNGNDYQQTIKVVKK